MKYIEIGGERFSKVICGTNPFLGRSHFSAARDAEYVGRYDDATIKQTIKECLRRGVIHAQYVDRPRKGDSIGGLESLIAKIHDAGLLAGISTHRIETVELCESQGYEIDTYLFPLNLTGFAYPGYRGTETVQERVDLVQGVNKPFILIKVLGAGRIPPDEGLQFVAENSKPNDLIDIGFGTDEEAAESIELVDKYF